MGCGAVARLALRRAIDVRNAGTLVRMSSGVDLAKSIDTIRDGDIDTAAPQSAEAQRQHQRADGKNRAAIPSGLAVEGLHVRGLLHDEVKFQA